MPGALDRVGVATAAFRDRLRQTVRTLVHVAYDEDLAQRIRALVGTERGLTEKKMFGGLAFLVGGNMAIAASGQGGVLVRVGPGAVGPVGRHHEGVGGRHARAVRCRAGSGSMPTTSGPSASSEVGRPRSRLRAIAAREGIIRSPP